MKKRKIIGRTIGCSLSLLLLCGSFWYSRTLIPDTLRVFAGEEQHVAFRVPVSGSIYDQSAKEVMSFPVTNAVTILAGRNQAFQMQLKLFGVLPIRDVDLKVADKTCVYPGGEPIGIYMKTNGAMVIGIGEFIGADGMKYAPAKYLLKEGDYVLSVNEEPVLGKKELMEKIRSSEGRALQIIIQRDGEEIPMTVTPKADERGVYKLGIWIRDNAQGVGTMTFFDKEGAFGALGHGINDVDTGSLMKLQYGELYHTDIVGIRPGDTGAPGEMTGLISYREEHKIGDISQNTEHGIFGTLNQPFQDKMAQYHPICEEVPIANKQEIEKGPAIILSAIDGSVQPYEISIERINYSDLARRRELELVVTDRSLIEMTGGIIQGMSGSPILQNGKLIGAVTHVLVNDPTKGYGIFIEEMLKKE